MGTIVDVNKLHARIEALEKEARHTQRQFQMLIHHHEHVDSMVQKHELVINKMQDDHR